jgi:hypothetical protein
MPKFLAKGSAGKLLEEIGLCTHMKHLLVHPKAVCSGRIASTIWTTPHVASAASQRILMRDETAGSNQSMSQQPHMEMRSACLPRRPAVAYLCLVR